jgi:multiple sugar transport system permease protein
MESQETDMKLRKDLAKYLLWFTAIVIGVIMLMPFLWTLAGAFKFDAEVAAKPLTLIPDEPTLYNFEVLFERIPFFRQFFNSIFVSLVTTSGAIIMNALVAYGFARFEFRGKKLMFLLVLSTLMIPPQVLIVPQFTLFVGFGWLNTYFPLILPGLVSGFFIYLLNQILITIPKDLFESATIDGANEFLIFRIIALPLAKSGIAIISLLRFMQSWNDFFAPLLYLNDPQKLTLPVGLATLRGFTEITMSIPMAGALLSALPIILLLSTVGNKYFVQGITSGALKG